MFKLIALIFVIYASSASGQDTSKLHIGLYYGPLCWDSFNFVTNQLAAVYQYIADYVDILYIPFGKSESVNGGESFICQHGAPACDGSRLQLCSLHLLNGNQIAQNQYVVCQMRIDSDRTGQACAELVGLDFTDVLACFDSDLGTELQLEAEILTNTIQYPLVWVPTIAFNHTFNQDLQNRAEFDFLNVVCEQLITFEDPRIPLECTDIVPY